MQEMPRRGGAAASDVGASAAHTTPRGFHHDWGGARRAGLSATSQLRACDWLRGLLAGGTGSQGQQESTANKPHTTVLPKGKRARAATYKYAAPDARLEAAPWAGKVETRACFSGCGRRGARSRDTSRARPRPSSPYYTGRVLTSPLPSVGTLRAAVRRVPTRRTRTLGRALRADGSSGEAGSDARRSTTNPGTEEAPDRRRRERLERRTEPRTKRKRDGVKRRR